MERVYLSSKPIYMSTWIRMSMTPSYVSTLVRVDWIKKVPKHEAIWEKEMFANQSSECRLRNQFKIERLTEHFQIDEE